MNKNIEIKELIGKNVNFLIGSGASFGYIPTLKIDDLKKTYEELLNESSSEEDKEKIYNYYYNNIVKKAYLNQDDNKEEAMKNYKKFIKKLLDLQNMDNIDNDKKVNIFTTNYDLFFEKASDEIIAEQKYDFYFNDGGNGNITRIFSILNYDRKILDTGMFSQRRNIIPIINLFKIHGSVSWELNKDKKIEIKYNQKENNDFKLTEIKENKIEYKKNTREKSKKKFIEMYNKLAIVNPTKKKFEETVLDENFFQMVRTLSYALEKDNTILIVFGFSFADEHIREIVRRNLKNPELMVYIYCYNKESYDDDFNEKEENKFLINARNVHFILPEDNGSIDFTNFNKKLFNAHENEVSKEETPNENEVSKEETPNENK